MHAWRKTAVRLTGCWLLLAGMGQAWAQIGAGGTAGSPHHNEAGFFDMHVCNWPGQPVFLMALFSTTRFNEIAQIEVFDPGKRALAKLDLSRYRLVRDPGNSEKRVFIANIPVPPKSADGWYSARVTMRSGKQLDARDFVALGTLARAAHPVPADGAENLPLPQALQWDPVPGAKFYQVFIKDMWDGERLIYTSPMLEQAQLILPAGLLQPGGLYSWRVHARDLNEDPTFGDFNLGSLSREMTFSVAP